MTETTSQHSHTVIVSVRIPDHPEAVRVVGVLLHEQDVLFAVFDRIGPGTAAILPDKIQLDPMSFLLRHNDERAAHYI
jgi:hypothetical protein